MRMPSDEAASAPVYAIDPVFAEMAIRMGKAAWSISELSQREKAIVCIAGDVCVRDLGVPFEMHVRMAAANQVPLGDVRETILQSAIEAGYPAALSALRKFKEICGTLGTGEASDEQGAPATPPIEHFQDTFFHDRKLAMMWKSIMASHWSRPGLNVRERAYISLTGNVLQGVVGESFERNVTIALAGGASVEQLRALCRFLSEFGFSRALAALAALSAIT